MTQEQHSRAAAADVPVGEADVVNAYALLLGRAPENERAIADKVGLAQGDLVQQFVGSREFEERIERAVLEGRPPAGPMFERPPETAMLQWAAGFFPLSDSGRANVGTAATWTRVFDAIFHDPAYAQAAPDLDRLFPPGRFAAQLETLSVAVGSRDLVAEVETASGLSVSGFALDRAAIDVPMAVELWIEGAFVGATVASIYRRDLQDRFGGSGEHGFQFERFAPPGNARAGKVRVQVRDAGAKVVLGSAYVDWRPEQEMARIAEIGSKLESVRDTLEQLELTVQRLTGTLGFRIDTWDSYWGAYYPSTPAAQERDRLEAGRFLRRPRFTVALAVEDGSADELHATLLSLRAQSWREFEIAIASGAADPAAIEDIARTRAFRLEGHRFDSDYVVTLDAGDRISPDALHRFAAALQTTNATLIYADSDELTLSPTGRERHANPVLRPDFDPDLLLQAPFFGPVAAVSALAMTTALDDGGGLRQEERADLLLRVAAAAADAPFVHVPRVLHHAAAGTHGSIDYLPIVQKHLDRIGSETAVAPLEDACGATIPGAVKVIWPLRRDTRAAVIVPTRDRLDLLGPCLASLVASRERNEVEFEIVVVDNGSAQAATRRFLNAMASSGDVTLLGYQAQFNWSAINNHAARSVSADVLVFLNNDTVVLEPTFIDALCRQALRPEVGVVGARLLYEDGAIQHAGIILGAGEGVGLHEGVGCSPREAGYLDRRSLVHRASAVTGACLATRADLFRELGGFDEDRLAVEGNDIDYCLRARRAGYAVIYEPAATLYHFESKSRGQTGLDDERRRKADVELDLLRNRWGRSLREDPFYNAHFDRGGQPFSRLGPPPP